MTSKVNAKLQRNVKSTSTPAAPAKNPYSASVPISLYREVASELQSTKVKMESLRLQNQQLSEQNQQLRIEIERVVQSALQLRQTADSHKLVNPTTGSLPLQELEIHFDAPPALVKKTEPPASAENEYLEPAVAPKPLFTEQEPSPRHSHESQRSSEAGGWWLMVIICLIVVTAFGTGFLVVRPLLPQR